MFLRSSRAKNKFKFTIHSLGPQYTITYLVILYVLLLILFFLRKTRFKWFKRSAPTWGTTLMPLGPGGWTLRKTLKSTWTEDELAQFSSVRSKTGSQRLTKWMFCRITQWPSRELFSSRNWAFPSWPCPRLTKCRRPLSIDRPCPVGSNKGCLVQSSSVTSSQQVRRILHMRLYFLQSKTNFTDSNGQLTLFSIKSIGRVKLFSGERKIEFIWSMKFIRKLIFS